MSLLKDEARLREVLEQAHVVAVVGYSNNSARASYNVGGYLKRVGYKVYAVNPTIKEIDGEPTYASLADVPEQIDIVDVFRRSEYLDELVNDAVAVGAKTIWTQLGVYDEAALNRAVEAGLNVVADKCIKVEHGRLLR